MPKKVLIVDDEDAIVSAITVRLQAAGYEVFAASDGKSALAVAEGLCPDVLVLDIRMPDMDGFEVARRLKATPGLTEIPIVFVSANVRDWAKEAAFAAGASFCLSKPYDAKQLLSAIEAATSAGVCQKG